MATGALSGSGIMCQLLGWGSGITGQNTSLKGVGGVEGVREATRRRLQRMESDESGGGKYWTQTKRILDEMVAGDGHRTLLGGAKYRKDDGVYIHMSEYPQSGLLISGSVIVDGRTYIHPADEKGNRADELPSVADLVDYRITCIEEGLDFVELVFSTEGVDR